MASFFSKLNPTPAFPRHSGPYKVGTVDVEIDSAELQDSSSAFCPASTIAFRCFYPCESPSKPNAPVYWVQTPQRSTLSAYARFLGAGNAFSDYFSYFPQLLYHIQIPAHRNAPLLSPPTRSNKWPVLVFSHGLGGTRNSYSHLCGTLASFGMVVLAPESRDGSCPISYIRATKDFPSSTVDYKRISHKVSPEVYQARDEMVETRLWELSLLHEAILKIDAGRTFNNVDTKSAKLGKSTVSETLRGFCGNLAVHDPASIAWAGHSFGAATTVQFLKSIFYHPHNPSRSKNIAPAGSPNLLAFEPSAALLSQVTAGTPTILLDLWTLPLNSPNASINKLPMPYYTSGDTNTSPILAILSRAFVNWTGNFDHVKRHLRAPSTSIQHGAPLIFYPASSAHLSQSDFGVLFPRVTKYLAKAEEPERTLKLNTRAILEMLRGKGFEVAGNDDPAILSTKEDAVRGWIAVRSDEPDAPGNDQPRAKDGAYLTPVASEAEAVGNGELSAAKNDTAIRSKH